MPDLLTLPEGAPIQTTDEVMIVRGDETYAVTVAQLLTGLQAALSLSQNTLLGRTAAGAGAPAALPLGAGVALSGGALVANATDHLALTALGSMDAAADLVVNSAGAPRRLPWPLVQSFMKNQLAWLDGAGAPSNTLGVEDDYYIDTDTASFYRKAGGGWVLKGSFRGPAGAWLTGTGVPSNGTGGNEDYYLRTTNGDFYQKQSGAWVKLGTLQGPAGEAENQFLAALPAITADTTLSAAIHNGGFLKVIGADVVISVDDPVALTDGFNCLIMNLSSTPILFAGALTNPGGATTLPAGGAAVVMVAITTAGAVARWYGRAS